MNTLPYTEHKQTGPEFTLLRCHKKSSLNILAACRTQEYVDQASGNAKFKAFLSADAFTKFGEFDQARWIARDINVDAATCGAAHSIAHMLVKILENDFLAQREIKPDRLGS